MITKKEVSDNLDQEEKNISRVSIALILGICLSIIAMILIQIFAPDGFILKHEIRKSECGCIRNLRR